MLKIDENIKPQQDILNELALFQKEIDGLNDFNRESKRAGESFSAKNKKGNRVFDAIKVCLMQVSVGIERCIYCENSQCDEVEHIYPKTLYPEKCFIWENYAYVCGPCNGKKNNKFAIYRHSDDIKQLVNPENSKQPILKPPKGESVLINPRVENPLDYAELDFTTGFFTFPHAVGTKEFERAHYTFNEVLGLNERLFKKRKSAYTAYKARLVEYVYELQIGASQDILNHIIGNLRNEDHPTVWKEMQRQFRMGWLSNSDPRLHELFNRSLPESLTW